MSSKGSLIIVLHAHLPYINHPEHPSFLEESWFFEGVVETYIPLISMIERLTKEGISPAITLSISPTLGAMFENEILEKKLRDYIKSKLELIEREISRTADIQPLSKTLLVYRNLYEQADAIMHRYSGDLITPFKQFQHAGHIEIITSSSTHAILPLLIHPEALRAQIQVSADDYYNRFNRKPSGFWLPECAYDDRIQTYLKLSGFNYFFTESHAIDTPTDSRDPDRGVGNPPVSAGTVPPAPQVQEAGSTSLTTLSGQSESKGMPSAGNGVFAPYKTANGVNVFARDFQSSKEIWSARFGYPGHASYREFYKDFGFDADYDYIKPYLLEDGIRRSVGLKYHRITGDVDLSKKELYDPDEALAMVERHSADFLQKRMLQIDDICSNKKIKPVIVNSFDAELFGHWWFEGPAFLENIIRKIRQERLPVQIVTPSQYLNSCAEPRAITPGMSSWGENGYFDPWLNESNDWIYPEIIHATEKMIEAANKYKNQDSNLAVTRALNQAAREVLLSQASDWPFLMYTNSHSEYAISRVKSHCKNAMDLLSQVFERRVDENFVYELELKNNVFTGMDFRIFSSISNF